MVRMNFSQWRLSGTRARTVGRTLAWSLAAVCCTALLLAAAYQYRPTTALGIGDSPHDTALVRDFNAQERQQGIDHGTRFRWTRGTSDILFPGIGGGAYGVDLILAGSINPAPDTRVLANGVEVATLPVAPGFQQYHVAVPAALMTHGSLTLTLSTAPFSPRGDRRPLGVAVERVELHPLDRDLALPPRRIAFLLWFAALCGGLAMLLAGFSGGVAFAAATTLAGGMAVLLIVNRLFLTEDAGGVARAGVMVVVVAAAIRTLLPPLCRRCGLPTTARDTRWLAVIVAFALALRFAGVLHPGIIIGDLTFHLHRFADVADRHMLLLPVESKEFGGNTILYVPTPYLVMLPLSWVIRDRTLMLLLFALGIDAARFCLLWFVARRATGDLRVANLTILTMALMPVGWIVYSWGIFANIFAEGMLTILFALLILGYDKLDGPRRWRWCALFGAVICLTLLSHYGVFVLTTLTVTLYLLARIVQNMRRRERPWARGVAPFTVAAVTAAVVAFALFYRIPAQDLLAGRHLASVEKEATNVQAAPATRLYRTGGATPDDRNGLPAVTTPHLAVALAREAWEISFAFYRVWPIILCVAGVAILRRTEDSGLRIEGEVSLTPGPSRTEPSPKEFDVLSSRRRWRGEGNGFAAGLAPDDSPSVLSPESFVLTLSVWLTVAAAMLVVGIVARLYVRYPLYALPAVSLGVGVSLGWLTRHGRWGVCAAVGLLMISVILLAFFWYSRIVYDWKVIV